MGNRELAAARAFSIAITETCISALERGQLRCAGGDRGKKGKLIREKFDFVGESNQNVAQYNTKKQKT